MNKLKWIWKVLFCRHEWYHSSVSKWNLEHNSKHEPSERVAFCTKCSMAVRVKEWKEVGL